MSNDIAGSTSERLMRLATNDPCFSWLHYQARLGEISQEEALIRALEWHVRDRERLIKELTNSIRGPVYLSAGVL